MSMSKLNRAKYAKEAEKRMDELGNYREVTNAPVDGKPYLIRELFSSKKGIINILTPLKGMGHSEFASVAKIINDEKKKYPQWMDKEEIAKYYLVNLAENFEYNLV